MHEAGLQVNAQQHAKPDQVDAHLFGHRCQHRHDDEGDLKEVEKESQEENEQIDHDQKTHLAAWQTGQQMLNPHRTVYTLKHLAENP